MKEGSRISRTFWSTPFIRRRMQTKSSQWRIHQSWSVTYSKIKWNAKQRERNWNSSKRERHLLWSSLKIPSALLPRKSSTSRTVDEGCKSLKKSIWLPTSGLSCSWSTHSEHRDSRTIFHLKSSLFRSLDSNSTPSRLSPVSLMQLQILLSFSMKSMRPSRRSLCCMSE